MINQKYLPHCPCPACQRERIRRLIAAAAWWLVHNRNVLNMIIGEPPHVPAWRVGGDGGYLGRESIIYGR